MLRITKAEEQGIRLVMGLAAAGRQMTLAELAEYERLPEPTVAKLLGMLRRGGVVAAVRGRHGGYALAAAPSEISTAAIIRALGSEPVQAHACLADPEGEDCPRLGDCGLRSVWRHLEKRVAGLLERTSVADLLEVEDSVARHASRVWPASLEAAAETDTQVTEETAAADEALRGAGGS
jgi:Rrf2 family protein